MEQLLSDLLYKLMGVILDNSSPNRAYFYLVSLFIAVGLIALAVRYLLGERQVTKKEIMQALVIIFILALAGWFSIPKLSKMIWDFGNDGRPSVEESIEKSNKTFQDINYRRSQSQ